MKVENEILLKVIGWIQSKFKSSIFIIDFDYVFIGTAVFSKKQKLLRSISGLTVNFLDCYFTKSFCPYWNSYDLIF